MSYVEHSVSISFENTITIDGVTYMIEGIFFYNSRIKRYMGLVRDKVTKRFLAGIRSFMVCTTCTFQSGGRNDWSKNIRVESRACVEIRRDDYYYFTSDEQFRSLLDTAKSDAESECSKCMDLFFVYPQEIRGSTYWLLEWSRHGELHSEPPADEYCSKIHFDRARVVRKVACYDSSGRRTRCPSDVSREGSML